MHKNGVCYVIVPLCRTQLNVTKKNLCAIEKHYLYDKFLLDKFIGRKNKFTKCVSIT